MANADKMLYGGIQPGNIATDSKTNGIATAAQAAPSSGQCLLITKIVVTASAAPAATARALVQHGAGPSTYFGINLPAAAFSPLVIDFGTHPIVCAEAEAAQVVVPALGAGVICDVTLFTVTSSV